MIRDPYLDTRPWNKIDEERLWKHVVALAQDPLPCRCLNSRRVGSSVSTLSEADAYIRDYFSSLGYELEEQVVPVQAFQPDCSVAHGFRKPRPHEPWYDAVNLLYRKKAVRDEPIILVAHKDSQSWLGCAPGAYDNAVGVAATLELARICQNLPFQHPVWFLYCNEEHWPWTSVEAAKKIAAENTVLAVLNVDSIGGKAAGQDPDKAKPHVVRYTTAEGKRLAGLIDQVNHEHDFGLSVQTIHQDKPNDDDGSFVLAGIRTAILNIGSLPYADPHYHTLSDRPDCVDYDHVARSTRLICAAVLKLDNNPNLLR